MSIADRHRKPAVADAGLPGSSADLQLTVVSPKVDIWKRVVAIWRFRELYFEMTRKELRVQYKNSVLGLLWSLINPLTTMLVYFVVFQIVLKNGIPRFAIYLLSGTLAWNFFLGAVTAATGSVVNNAPIIKKVAFPREIPALALITSNLVQMGYQVIVLLIFYLAFWHGPAVAYLPLMVPALIALILFTSACGILFAAINVSMRDTQYLLGVAMQVWFWGTPIIYEYRLIRDRFIHWVVLGHKVVVHTSGLLPIFILWRLNPITPIVLTFQRCLYSQTTPRGTNGVLINILPNHAGEWWYLWQLLLVIGFSMVLFVFALRVFSRYEGNFAEEL